MIMCRNVILALALYGVVDAFQLSTLSSIGFIRQSIVGRNNQFHLYADTTSSDEVVECEQSSSSGFDTDTALFCAGLAFDAYVEPPADSSRWERGVSKPKIQP